MTTLTPALRKIQAVEAEADFRLAIVWVGGRTSVVDLSKTIAAGGVFAALNDPARFGKVRIGPRQRTIEWPEPADAAGAPSVDIDAEALSVMSSSDRVADTAGTARRRTRPPVPSAPGKRHG